MNRMFLILSVVLMLSGCGQGASVNPDSSPVGTPTGQCQANDPSTGFCGTDPNINQMLPTADVFGDSINLGISAEARHDLCGIVDLRHNAWESDGIPMCGKEYSSYAVGEFVKDGINDGCAESELTGMQWEFSKISHFNVILFTAGLHDFQGNRTQQCGSSTPEQFRDAVEKLADLVQQHADYIPDDNGGGHYNIIWIDTPPIVTSLPEHIPYGIQDVINPIGEEIAREHHFYILELPIDPSYHIKDDVHFMRQGYQIMGEWMALCLTTMLNGTETSNCHR